MVRGISGVWLIIILVAAGGCTAPRQIGTPPAPPAPPAKPAAPRVLAPAVRQGDAARLEQEVQGRIRETERLAAGLDPARLTPDQKATVATVRSFLDRARESLARQDLAGASNLAEKAHALAAELSRQR